MSKASADSIGYPIPKQRIRQEIEIRKSRFITTLAPVSTTQDTQAFLAELKREFPDASHHCWAFLIGAPKSSACVGMSDDGEPKGTAGRPMLTVLLHAEIGDVMVVVTRYFGGTKLGTGGLMRAYSDCVKQMLSQVETTQRICYCAVHVQLGYADFDLLQRRLQLLNASLADAIYTEQVAVMISLPDAHWPALHDYLSNHPQIQFKLLDGL